MAFMSVLLMWILFLIIACLFLGGVILCWILTIIFTATKNRTARNVAFVIATVSTLACIGIGGWFYWSMQHDKVRTKDGKEVPININLADELQMAIRQDDVDGVKKCLNEKPEMITYVFRDDNVGVFAKALEYDAVEVLTYLLENRQEVDDFDPFVDETGNGYLVHNAVHFYFHYKCTWDGLYEMDGNEKNVYDPQIVRLLLRYGSNLALEDGNRESLLQNVLICFCADGDFSEDEYSLLCELEEAGMQMNARFVNWEEEDRDWEEEYSEEEKQDARSCFEKMAKKLGIDTRQPDVYERVCQKLQRYE